jgi:predicted ATPase/DNA-binding XRE family transcriptional regulator
VPTYSGAVLPDPSPIAELVRRFRRSGGLSQAALARACGVSERAIRDIERGATARPRAATLRAIAGALRLRPEERAALLGGGSPPTGAAGLVGRQRELGELIEVVRRAVHRLVTVIGTGGVGKSRLAAEAAAVLAGGAGLPVRVLDLSGLTDPAMVGEVIAEAVGAGGRSRLDAVARIAAELRDRRLVLVLDGVERVVAAAPRLRELVARCPALTVVATSRVPLRVGGERLLRLDPLPVPAAGVSDPAELAAVPAMELLVRRAVLAWPGFELTPGNAAALARVCRAAEGLPLGLELAAARLRTLSPAELAARLDRRLELLSDGPRDLPGRQRSLRATIEHSLDLVGEPSRRLFARLAPFPAGALLADLEAIVSTVSTVSTVDGADGADGDAAALLDALAGLVDASLLRPHRDPAAAATRYVLPDATRELAAELLAGSGERDAVLAAFADHYLARVRAAGRDGYAGLDAEAGNVRAAVSAAGEVDVPTVEALFGWYEIRGRFVEGRAALTVLGARGNRGAAWALLRAGRLAQHVGDQAGAEELARRGAAGLRPEDAAGHAVVGLLLGTLAVERGDLAAADRHTRAAVAAAQAAGDQWTVARALHNLAGTAWYAGEFDRARALMAQALAAKRLAGADDADLGRTLRNLAELAYGCDDPAQAAVLAAEAVALLSRSGQVRYHAMAYTVLALARLPADRATAGVRQLDAAGVRQSDAAGAAMHEAVRLTDQFGEDTALRGLVLCRSSLVLAAAGRYAEAAGSLAAGAGTLSGLMMKDDLPTVVEQHAALLAGRHPDRAARLLGIAAALRQAGGRPADPRSTRTTAQVRDRCAALLGAGTLAARVAHAALPAADLPAALATLMDPRGTAEAGAPELRGPRGQQVSRTTAGRTTRPPGRRPPSRTAR